MSGDVRVFNRQRARAVDTRLLRRMTRSLLTETLGLEEFDLAVHLVGARAMAGLNQLHLSHEGPTDVITLDYSMGYGTSGAANESAKGPAGEIMVCVDVAAEQARRFQATWQTELARYVIHGILHLQGHDDQSAAGRRRMKREEGRLLKELGGRFHLSKLARKTKVNA
jgi:probable rRNA maturation factor